MEQQAHGIHIRHNVLRNEYRERTIRVGLLVFVVATAIIRVTTICRVENTTASDVRRHSVHPSYYKSLRLGFYGETVGKRGPTRKPVLAQSSQNGASRRSRLPHYR